MKAVWKHQRFLRSVLIGSVGCVAGGVLWVLLSDDVSSEAPLPEEKPVKVDTSLPASSQEMFYRKMEHQNGLLKERLEAQEKILETLMKIQSEGAPSPDEALRTRIADLEKRLEAKESLESSSSVKTWVEGGEEGGKVIERVKVSLVAEKGVKTGKTVETSLPAGSFVKALILGGVAASTSISASQNPKPVLLNLVDKGQLPRGFFGDLKECRLTAASHGDLSSERVSMRLEKLSCVERTTGEIIEVPVSGYVVGEDGFEGVKGAISDRTGPLLRNSFVAGFFGGLSSAIGQQAMNNPLLSTPLGVQQKAPDASQLLRQGAGKGVQGAMEKYADFYIKRAEQMQPVLYVRAGRKVDVVFTEGVSLGDTLVRKALKTSQEGARLHEVRKMSEPSEVMRSHQGGKERVSW